MNGYLPRLVSLPDGHTIPLVGVTGNLAAIAWEDDLPLTALAMDAQEPGFKVGVVTYDAELIAEGLCPDLIMVDTEDGPVTGRCRAPITDHELCACEGHAAERREWMSMTEWERCQWERQHDRENP